MSSELDARKLDILSAVVKTYIATSLPVGSKAVASMLRIPVSSATIRNEMAALIKLGYLEQPHTSAGRVPSHRGIRLYLNELMHAEPLEKQTRDLIDSYFNIRDPDPTRLLSECGKMLAYLTDCAAVVTALAPEDAQVTKIDVIQVSKKNFLLLLVTSAGQLKSKRCNLELDMPFEALAFFIRLVNDRFCGIKLRRITKELIQAIAVQLGEYTLMFTPLLVQIYDLAQSACRNIVYLTGETNLLAYKEFEGHARELLSFLENKQELLGILSHATHDVNILIGRETKKDELADVSIVAAKYEVPDCVSGCIGVIGPSRMDYPKLLPMIEYFSSVLSKILTDSME